MAIIKSAGKLLFDTYEKWLLDRSPRLAAALAYYTLFSLSPLLIILVAVLGQILGTDTARETIINQVETFAGVEVAEFIGSLISNASSPAAGQLATIISLSIIFWGASNVFNHLKESLNTIWGVRPEQSRGVLIFIRGRALAFLAIFFVGLVIILYVSLTTMFSTFVPLMSRYLPEVLPEILPAWRIIQWGSQFLAFILMLLMFAFTYKVLPDVNMTWRDVWVGALVTAILFAIGNLAIGFYLSRASIGSAFGAASSIMVVLIWVYFSAQIFLYGAEFTYIYANRFGSKVVLASYTKESSVKREAQPSGAIQNKRVAMWQKQADESRLHRRPADMRNGQLARK